MKKLFVAFGIILITLLCSISAFAAETDDSGMWEYQAYKSGVELTKYKGTQSDVYVPSKITKGETEYSVLKLSDNLFKENTALNSATLGDGITEIGASSFEGATNLVCIVAPEGLATIGNSAFSGCTAFNSVILYNSITSIGENAFAGCEKLTIYCNEDTPAYKYAISNRINYKILNPNATPEEITLNGITYYILDGKAAAAAYNGVTANVVIPATVSGYPVTSIKDIFRGKTGLKTLKIEAKTTAIANSMFSGCSSLTSILFPESINSIGSSAFSGCSSLVNIQLPEEVESIGSNAFEGCSALTAIEIPKKITSIPSYAFNKCSGLKHVALPEGLYSINQYAFNDCRVLEDISIPDTVRVIDDYAFGGCAKLKNINIPDGISTLGFSCFEGCKALKKVVIPNSVTKLEGDNFRDCSGLEEITLPGNMDTWRLEFSGCTSLKKVIFSEGSTTIKAYNGFGWDNDNIEPSSEYEFNNVLSEIVFPSTTKTIEPKAFYVCTAITEINLPEGLTTIGANAFVKSTGLKSVVIPQSVTSISTNSFHSTTLWIVHENSYAHNFALENGIPYILFGESVKEYILGGITYYIVDGKATAVAYDGTTANVVIPATVSGYPVTSIKDIFRGKTGLKTLKIEAKTTATANSMFSGCSSLTSILFPESINSIGSSAFSGCSSLVNIQLPEEVESIGSNAFEGCSALTAIEIPKKITSIPSYAFNKCSGLKHVALPEGLYSINQYAFNDCRVLEDISIPDTVRVIDDYAFGGCAKLKNINIPDGISTLGFSCFEGCKALKKVVIPNSVTKLEGDNFRDCSGLEEITLPGNMDTWRLEFSGCTSLKKVIFSEGSTTIKAYNGFGWDNDNIEPSSEYEFNNVLSEIVFPSTTKTIEPKAFYVCTAITEINLPEGLTTIGANAFVKSTGLKSVVIPQSVTSISTNSFHSTTLWIVHENSYAHNFALENGIPYILFGESVKEYILGGITYYIVDGKATAVAYDGTTANVVIPATVSGYPVTSIKDIFRGKTGLKTLKIEAKTTATANSMFSGCSSLTSILFPESINSIGSSAFSGCSSLVNIQLPEEVESIGSNAFEGCSALTAIEIPKKITSIPSYAFNKCSGLKHVALPEGLYSINQYAFNDCRVLEDISIPDTVRVIDDYAFGGCAKLKNINIPDGISTLGFSCFEGCKALKKVVIPNSVTKLEGDNFRDCSGLEEITLPGNMDTWRLEFSGCTSLKKVIFSEGSTTIKAYNGFGWDNDNIEPSIEDEFNNVLSEIVFPSTTKTIEPKAFYVCTAITEINLPEGLTTIGANAFVKSTRLKSVVIPRSVTSISANSFHNTTLWLVYENSYAHTFAEANNCMYFIIHKVANPEISYGSQITGTATYNDGTATTGATVEILYDDGTVKETVTTDENGSYKFTYAEVGRYTIRVTDSNGNAESEIVSVKRMNAFDVYLTGETDLVLKKGYNVSGIVTPATAKVTISDINGNIIKSIDVTSGTFAFSNISRGTYIVKAENETGSATTEIYVSNEDVTGITLEIEAQSATISGETKIENRDRTYSTKIWISLDLIDSDGNVIASAKTDADGKYSFEKVPAGKYNIVAKATEMRPAYGANFDKSFELTGYGFIEITEAKEYTVDTIILREEKVNLTSLSGKVTANGSTQNCQVILTNEDGDQIAVFTTDKNGKYSFTNIPDGMYSITAITKADGMGYTVVTIENGVVYGDTDIKVAKSDKISKREETLLSIPDCNTKSEALIYKEAVMAEKTFYDSLSEKERKQLSEEWTIKLFKLIGLLSDSNVNTTAGVTVENIESVIATDEIEESIDFTLTVVKTSVSEAGENGITSEKEYETEKIKDKKGKNKEIVQYYDIALTKDGKNISNIQKQTETNGKLLVTMEIPEEYKGHKQYSFIHMHNGEAVTLVDLDANPDTVTFEIDKFSTFALAYSDAELVGKVEQPTYPASITYNAETGKITVSASEKGTLFIVTYNGKQLQRIESYSLEAEAPAADYDFHSNQTAFVWSETLRPLSERFTITN